MSICTSQQLQRHPALCRPQTRSLQLSAPRLQTRRVAASAAASSFPDASSSTYSNLGALSRTVVVTDPPVIELDPYAGQRVSVESLANRGAAVDGGTAAVNVVILLLLIALSFERIFGLDKVLRIAWLGRSVTDRLLWQEFLFTYSAFAVIAWQAFLLQVPQLVLNQIPTTV
jgi:hypothetical protein